MNVFAPFRAGLAGLAQIMLIDNPVSGLLLLAGLAVNSPLAAFAAVVGVAAGMLPAWLLGWDRREIDQGLHGFNAALVGIALVTFLQPGALVWAAIVAGGALASLLGQACRRWGWPVFTLPFIATTLLLLGLLPMLGASAVAGSGNPTQMPYLGAVANSIGQVLFQGNPLSGALFLAAIWIAAPTAAIYAALGTALAVLFAAALGQPPELIGAGLLGYNAALCAIVFSGETSRDGLFALGTAAVSVLVHLAFSQVLDTPLTLAFIVTTWGGLALRHLLSRRRGHGLLTHG